MNGEFPMCLELLQLTWCIVRNGFALYGASFYGVLPQAYASRLAETDLGKGAPAIAGRAAGQRFDTQPSRNASWCPTDGLNLINDGEKS
jgi:hypothetical protein